METETIPDNQTSSFVGNIQLGMLDTAMQLLKSKFPACYSGPRTWYSIDYLETYCRDQLRAATAGTCIQAAAYLARQMWSQHSGAVTAAFTISLEPTVAQPFKRAISLIEADHYRVQELQPVAADGHTPQWGRHNYTILSIIDPDSFEPLLLAASPSNWGIAGPDPLRTVFVQASLTSLFAAITSLEGGIAPDPAYVEANLGKLVPQLSASPGRTGTMVPAIEFNPQLHPEINMYLDRLELESLNQKALRQ